MKLNPKLMLSSNVTAEDIAGIPEIVMREAVGERPVCFSSHKVNADMVGGFELKVTHAVKEETL